MSLHTPSRWYWVKAPQQDNPDIILKIGPFMSREVAEKFGMTGKLGPKFSIEGKDVE